MSLSERLNKLIEHTGLTTNAFEKEIGVGTGTVAKSIANKTTISFSTIMKIINIYPDIDIHWLTTGQGSMIRTVSNNIEELQESYHNTKKESLTDINHLEALTLEVAKQKKIIYQYTLEIFDLKEEINKLKTQLRKQSK